MVELEDHRHQILHRHYLNTLIFSGSSQGEHDVIEELGNQEEQAENARSASSVAAATRDTHDMYELVHDMAGTSSLYIGQSDSLVGSCCAAGTHRK